MSRLITCLFLFTSACYAGMAPSSDLDQAVQEQEEALDKIFAELGTGVSNNGITRYGALFTRLIQRELEKKKVPIAAECRLRLSLSQRGNVEHVSMSDQSQLCRDVFNAIWEIKTFPMPADQKQANKLTDLSVNISM